tara:strand:- start:12443 stop:13396 length:954 start_codon:yes stop_codon:yes gene_type:complete
MRNKYIGIAKNKDDIDSAIDLVKNVFDDNSKKDNFIFPQESLKEKNIIVIKNDNIVIATCFMHKRLFNYKGEKIPASFLCYICVEKKMRGRGFSKELMDFAIKLSEKNGEKLSFVIARKDADYYYTKFSFYGFSNYPKILIKRDSTIVEKDIYFLKLKKSIVNQIIDIYNDTYKHLPGSFYRDLINWQFIIKKAKSIGVILNIIKDNNGLTIGYICSKGNDIFEIALSKKNYYPCVINNLLKDRESKSVNIHASFNHPLANFVDNFDHTFSIRKCWYGGHMIRVSNNEEKFKTLLDKKIMSNILKNEVFNIPLMDQI